MKSFVQLSQNVIPEPDWIELGNALIRHYLHKEPSSDLETWRAELKQALCLEKRYWKGWSDMLTEIVKAVFGKS